MTTDHATWGRGGRIRIDSVTVTQVEWLSSANVVIVVGTSISLITA